MDRRRTGLLLATSGTLAGALLARRALSGRPAAPTGTTVDLTAAAGPTSRSTPAGTSRPGRADAPRRFGWRSHRPVPDAAARSRVRVRAGGPAGIFAPADPRP